MHRNWTGRSSDRGSRRKILHEDGQLAMIVQWDAGYRMSGVELKEAALLGQPLMWETTGLPHDSRSPVSVRLALPIQPYVLEAPSIENTV